VICDACQWPVLALCFYFNKVTFIRQTRHQLTYANEQKDLGDNWVRVPEIFIGRREIIVDVNATIRVAIYPPVVE